MMTVHHGRDAKRRIYDEHHIGRVHEYFYHEAQQCTKRFWHFFSRVHSTSSAFCTVKCRGHWTVHDDFQGSITRFGYGHFQMSTCSYGSWSFSCMINMIMTDLSELSKNYLSYNWKPKIHTNTCSSGTDHNQILLWILGSGYGHFNGLGILQCEKEEKLNEPSKKCQNPLVQCWVAWYKYSWTLPM